MMETPEQVFARMTPRLGPGLGDVVAGATKAVGIKPCGKCRERQAALNRATPNYVRRLLAWATQMPMPWKK